MYVVTEINNELVLKILKCKKTTSDCVHVDTVYSSTSKGRRQNTKCGRFREFQVSCTSDCSEQRQPEIV